MSRVKMRYGHASGDAEVMGEVEAELADIMRPMNPSDPRFSPIYAAWAAASACRALLGGPPLRENRGEWTEAQFAAATPQPGEIERLKAAFDKTHRLTVLLHPGANAHGPIHAVAMSIEACAAHWAGDRQIWRDSHHGRGGR